MSANKSLPLSDEDLAAYEASRDLYTELKQSLQDLQAGRGRIVYSPIIAARKKTGLSTSAFAHLLGISTTTLENWEQQREKPTVAARVLIAQILENSSTITAK